MAYASKSEQRLQLSRNYQGGDSTLNSTTYKKVNDMGNNGPKLLYGKMGGSSNKDGMTKRGIWGVTADSSMSSGVAGKLSGNGYPSGPKWKRAMEPGELKPGKASQKGNTTRMTPGSGGKEVKMKVTSTTPKALRGGRVNP